MDVLISRQAAIDAMWDALYDYEGEYDERSSFGVICDVEKRLAALPFVQPKKGRWEIYIIPTLNGEGYRCSECGFESATYWDYCPKCGERMK